MHPAVAQNTSRVFPDVPASPRTVTVPLSILDASVGNFAPTGAAWIYDPPETPLDIDTLRAALVKTLNVYPQWAGQVQYTTYDPTKGHRHRSRRLEVVYGSPADPGVEFVFATSEGNVADLFPSAEQRASMGAVDITVITKLNLLPKDPLADGQTRGLPALIVQVTRFRCGGLAIALKACHPMADAQTLVTFVKDWAEIHRALLRGLPLPTITRLFEPSELDTGAAGDIDAPAPDQTLLDQAHELPVYRYDYWASSEGAPPFMAASTKIPPHLQHLADTGSIEYGPAIPWAEWDYKQPVSNYLIHFSASELSRIWEAASTPGEVVSRFDALQAHIWAALIRAHGHGQKDNASQFHFNLSLGLRERLPRPNKNMLGSPIVLARASATPQTTVKQMARDIRSTLTAFTPPRVGALLHEMAFDVDAQRMWGCCVGSRNTIVTSWVRLGVYEVDFGFRSPRFVYSVMPILEGIVQVMEAGPHQREGGEQRQWWRDGVSVSVVFTDKVLERLLGDPGFREFR
uniref:Transferase family protein n=1 Tax=Mycena chlorophos TaxID=658473 RepID=A0ABQ0L452_MYCCL|nr:predicted protein [Mycena chlorophos]